MSPHPERWVARQLDLGPVGQEIVKQTIDQPLHVAMCTVSVLAFACGLFSLALRTGPSAGETVAGALLVTSLVLGELATVAWVAIRELGQWPSSRWWDPWLDWSFEAGGCALGAWLFVELAAPALCSLARALC